MNIIKNIKNTSLILYVFFLLMLSGCELSQTDPSNFNTDNFFTNAEQANASVTSIYRSLFPMQDEQSWLITELRTGAANSSFGANGGFPSFANVRDLVISSDFPSVEVFWSSHYRGIANANLALKRIPDIQMDEAEKNRLLGQARFLRAYYYFNLVRLFGEIPLIREPVEFNDPNFMPNQAPIDAIYDLIVEDLTIAENSDLPFNDESGRVTLGAVKSLLAEVYLTMAGFPLQMGAEFYQLASNKAKEVIDSQEFHLFDSYVAFRDASNDNTGEYIFSVQFLIDEEESNSLQIGLPPFKLGVSEYSSEQGFSFAQREFVESYEDGDKRAEEKVFFFTNFTSEADRNEIVEFGQYFNFKFFDEEAHLNTAKSGLDWQIIRYADVLFDFAEASNEISGPTSDAYEAINKIRRRAGIPELSGLSKSEFREAIWKERWHETYYEGEIWFDMVRTRKAFDFLNNTFNDYVGHTFVDGKTLEEKHLLFPIPADELRNNPNLEQNPGF